MTATAILPFLSSSLSSVSDVPTASHLTPVRGGLRVWDASCRLTRFVKTQRRHVPNWVRAPSMNWLVLARKVLGLGRLESRFEEPKICIRHDDVACGGVAGYF